MFWTIVLGLILIGAVGLYFLYQRSQWYWPDLGVPLARSDNLLWLILKGDIDLVKNEKNYYEQFKGKRFGGFLEAFSPALYITDLDLMKQVYIKDFDHFTNRRGFELEDTDPHMHFSLFNQNGEPWKSLRTKMTPTFTTGKIRRMFQIFQSSSEKLAKALKEEAKKDPNNDGIVQIRPLIMKLTMDVIASAAFGVQSNIFEEGEQSAFARMGMKVADLFAPRNMYKLVFLVFFPAVAKLLRLKLTDDEADKFLSRIITDALARRQETGEKREDFVQIMLEARLGQISNANKQEEEEVELSALKPEAAAGSVPANKLLLTDDVIIAQCLLFFVAGFDTTESFLTFAIYELACCPEVQEKLYREVKEALDENNEEFSYEIVNKMEYLDMVVSETLRKYPPAVRTDRKSTKPFKIPGTQVVLPTGTIVVLPIYAVQHDPEYYPNPEKFDPERFTKENSVSRHPLAYQPFGHGPRNCIGNRFALLEGKVALANLVLNFAFEPCAKTIIPAQFAKRAPLKPSDDMPLTVKPRN